MNADAPFCRLCAAPITNTGTGLCDRCWELETRIHDAPELAQRILEEHGLAQALTAVKLSEALEEQSLYKPVTVCVKTIGHSIFYIVTDVIETEKSVELIVREVT